MTETNEAAEQSASESFIGEVSALAGRERDGEIGTAHLSYDEFNPRELTQADEAIWDMVQNSTATLDDLRIYRQGIPSGRNSRGIFSEYITHLISRQKAERDGKVVGSNFDQEQEARFRLAKLFDTMKTDLTIMSMDPQRTSPALDFVINAGLGRDPEAWREESILWGEISALAGRESITIDEYDAIVSKLTDYRSFLSGKGLFGKGSTPSNDPTRSHLQTFFANQVVGLGNKVSNIEDMK